MAEAKVPDSYQGLPAVSAERMRALDRLATEKHGLPVLKLMTNAGHAVAAEAEGFLKRALKRDVPGARIVVCCGRGANGGDGLVAARVLAKKGARVSVLLCPARKDDAGKSVPYPDYLLDGIERARKAGVKLREAGPASGLGEALAGCDAALDALLGTGAAGKPAGAIHHMIVELNRSGKPVLAIDIPSGLDPDTGERGGACVAAAATFTLGLPKKGLLTPRAKRFVGLLKVLDIGYPPELIREALGHA